jgi:mRNA interferase RelE/StbE
VAKYSIFLRQSVGKDLDPIPKNDVKRIMNRIAALADNPRPPGCEKLSALERYRVRQGDYRIVYSIQDDEQTVWIVKIGHRREVYRRQRNKP